MSKPKSCIREARWGRVSSRRGGKGDITEEEEDSRRGKRR